MVTSREIRLFSFTFFMLAINFTMVQSVFAGDVNEHAAKAKSVFERQIDALSVQGPELVGENALELDEKHPVEGDFKFIIHTISLTGLDKFTKSPLLLPLLTEYKGKSVTETELQALLEKLNKRLAEGGYITTRASIPPQNIKAGNLSIAIIPGRIHAFLCAENTIPLHWQNAFPVSIRKRVQKEAEKILEGTSKIITFSEDMKETNALKVAFGKVKFAVEIKKTRILMFL